MRIIGGQWRGRRLVAPTGRATRPTTDRVREAIFSSVYSLVGDLDDVTVIDLYAGSGALGFEALSRGARRCYFIDAERAAIGAITRNAAEFGVTDAVATIVQTQITPRLGARLGSVRASLLLADPPYRIDAAAFGCVLAGLAEAGAVAPGALVVYEHAAGTVAEWPSGFTERPERRYGDTGVSFAVYEGVLEP